MGARTYIFLFLDVAWETVYYQASPIHFHDAQIAACLIACDLLLGRLLSIAYLDRVLIDC